VEKKKAAFGRGQLDQNRGGPVQEIQGLKKTTDAEEKKKESVFVL